MTRKNEHKEYLLIKMACGKQNHHNLQHTQTWSIFAEKP